MRLTYFSHSGSEQIVLEQEKSCFAPKLKNSFFYTRLANVFHRCFHQKILAQNESVTGGQKGNDHNLIAKLNIKELF